MIEKSQCFLLKKVLPQAPFPNFMPGLELSRLSSGHSRPGTKFRRGVRGVTLFKGVPPQEGPPPRQFKSCLTWGRNLTIIRRKVFWPKGPEYGPLIIKTSYRRPHRLARPRTPAFQAGSTGSNPVGDANVWLLGNLCLLATAIISLLTPKLKPSRGTGPWAPPPGWSVLIGATAPIQT